VPKAEYPRYSPVAFLDESLSVGQSELFFTPFGRMLKQAVWFGKPERVLILVTAYVSADAESLVGTMYLVSTVDVSATFQLKEKARVLSFKQSPDGTVYYHAVEEIAREPASEGQEEDVLVKRHAPVSAEVVVHRLGLDGVDSVLEPKNTLVEGILPDGKLLLAEISGLTPFRGGYVRGITSRWILREPPSADVLYEFDYMPLLAGDLSIALEVVREYDTSDYSKSYFAIYEGAVGSASRELRLVFSCPYFITLEEERWEPVAAFLDDTSLLVSRFLPLKVAGGDEESGQAVPNTQGRLSLERFDLKKHQLRPLLEDVSARLAVLCEPGSPVFFYRSTERQDAGVAHRVWVVAADGSRARMLSENTLARKVELADCDFPAGSLLLVEHYETATGNYSTLRELRLSEERSGLPEGESPEGQAEDRQPGTDEQAPEEQGEAPPPISVPGGVA